MANGMTRMKGAKAAKGKAKAPKANPFAAKKAAGPPMAPPMGPMAPPFPPAPKGKKMPKFGKA